MRVVLRNGSVIISKFIERTGKYVVLEHGRFRGSEIASFCINRI